MYESSSKRLEDRLVPYLKMKVHGWETVSGSSEIPVWIGIRLNGYREMWDTTVAVQL